MKERCNTIEQFERRLAERPSGYLLELLPAITKRTATLICFDHDHPAHIKATERYKNYKHDAPTHPPRGHIPHGAVSMPPVAAPRGTTDRAKWPRLAMLLSKMAIDGDNGLGDTLERLAATVGGNQIKKLYKKIMGHDCGCGARQWQMNVQYPYR